MMNAKNLLALASMIVIVTGCSENEPFDGNSNGADVPPSGCAAPGTACSNEGGVCGSNTCHCGFWTVTGSDQCKAQCPNGQQPAPSCVPGLACATNGNTCSGTYGSLTCTCGMWATPDMASKLDCSNHNPGTGGSGGSGGGSNVGGSGGGQSVGGSGGGQQAPSGWHTFHIHVKAAAYHIYCQGANTATAVGSDGKLKWYQDWHSFGCDSYSGIYDCDVAVMDNAALQWQCYLENPDNSTAVVGDNLIDYTCRDPQSPLVYEFSVTDDGVLVQGIKLEPNGSPQTGGSFYNCVKNSD